MADPQSQDTKLNEVQMESHGVRLLQILVPYQQHILILDYHHLHFTPTEYLQSMQLELDLYQIHLVQQHLPQQL